jgi:response regulator RpfG family c-di-GMP phosphodiesterase
LTTECTEYILCVDDEYMVLESLRRELRQNTLFSGLNIETFESAGDALESIAEIIAEGGTIPVVISDQSMPGMNGDTFLDEVKKCSPDTLCILLTGYSDLDAVTRLVNKSALYRFMSKPWNRHDLMLTVSEAYNTHRQKQLLDKQNRTIERLSTILVTALESANEFYDEDTGAHIKRIPILSGLIARFAGFDENFVKRIQLYSSLHDIGKVGITQDILRKPGKLTPEEFEQIKEHVVIGHKIIDQEEIDVMVKNIVLYHHEKWSGTGYVHELSREEIPVEARIVALADVFDALISSRVYKPAYPIKQVLDIIRSEQGLSFDPALVDVFLKNITEILASINYQTE